MYILTISYEQLLFVSFTLCFLVCFLRLILHLCICICFGGPIRCLKIAGVSFRIEGRTFVVVNGTFPLKVWRFPWKNAARPARKRQSKLPALFSWVREGRWDAAAVAPSSFLTTAILGTNATFCFEITFFLLPFFSIEISLENNRHRSLQFFCLFNLVRCW